MRPWPRPDPWELREGGALRKSVLRGRDEFHRQWVDAVPRVLRIQPLSEEDVAEVTPADGALELGAVTVRIGQPPHGAGVSSSNAGRPRSPSNLSSER